MIINHDLVWLQGPPAIAAVHYYRHLRSTHVLYCPDDRSLHSEKNVRELARGIIAVLDSNKKKLAVHFMYPCAEKKLSEIVRAIRRTRPHLNVDCCVLQTSALQNQLLLGWSMGAMDGNAPDADLWIDEYKQLFCISDHSFTKKSLFVNVTPSLCATLPSPETGIAFTEGAIAAIQGWVDATRQLSIAGTLIMLVDEKEIYGKILKDDASGVQERLLRETRKATLASLAKLQVACPVYLYARDFFSRVPESIYDQIACMQHRHHLQLSYATCLHHSRKDAVSSQSAPLFSSIQQVYLNETMGQNRSTWKTSFTSIIKNSLAQVKTKQDELISLSSQVLDLSVDNKTFLLPLVKDWRPIDSDQTRQEEFGNRYIHSVTISDCRVLDSWKESIMKDDVGMNPSAEPTRPVELDLRSPKAISDSQDTPSKPDVDVFEGDTSELADAFARRLGIRMIEDYISNDKSYTRGKTILHHLDDLRFNGNDKVLTISAKAKGTAKDPYGTAVSFVAEHDDKGFDIIKGLCECPVGKEGKCKHCTALLLRFMINVDEFEYLADMKVPYKIDLGTSPSDAGDRLKQQASTTEETTPAITFEETNQSASPVHREKEVISVDDACSIPVSARGADNEARLSPGPSGAVMPPQPRTRSRFLPWVVAESNDPPKNKGRRRKAQEDRGDTDVAETKKPRRKPAKKTQAIDEFLFEDEPKPKRKSRSRKKAPSPSPSLSPQQPSPRSVSPEPIPFTISTPEITTAGVPQEIDDDVDSDATEEGLGPVMERASSWMSRDSPGLPTSTDMQDISSDDNKTDKSSPKRTAMDDLFDEIGL